MCCTLGWIHLLERFFQGAIAAVGAVAGQQMAVGFGDAAEQYGFEVWHGVSEVSTSSGIIFFVENNAVRFIVSRPTSRLSPFENEQDLYWCVLELRRSLEFPAWVWGETNSEAIPLEGIDGFDNLTAGTVGQQNVHFFRALCWGPI